MTVLEPGQLNPDTAFGTLTINGMSMFTGSWCIADMTALLDGQTVRGADRPIPGMSGMLPRRRRSTVTRKDLPIFVTGRYNQAGVQIGLDEDDWKAGLVANVEAFKAGLGIAEAAPAGATGTVAAVWTRPGLATVSAAVHVIPPFHWSTHLFVAQGVLTIEVVAGRFT